MNIVVKAQNLHPQKHNIDVEISIPTTCPRCGVAYREYPKDTYIFQCDSIVNYIGTRVYSFYFCPHCGKGFLVEYSVLDDFHHFSPSSTLKTCNAMAYPAPVRVKDFSQEIKDLSPNFVKIYHQAEQAENTGLSDTCGLGYRKALEFLVKDYAIAFNPTETESIKSLMLSPCINKYIDNPKIKALATASTWLGNDETHYVRKHEDYNIEHLKVFISSVAAFIESDLAYAKATALLNAPKS